MAIKERYFLAIANGEIGKQFRELSCSAVARSYKRLQEEMGKNRRLRASAVKEALKLSELSGCKRDLTIWA